jgi:hypothetical protein
MATPSNRTAVASLPMVVLVALILFIGLVLGPRAFEFRAWPEFSRHDAVEAIVDRPAPEVIEVRVARPEAGRHSSDALAVRGTRARGGRARGASADRSATLDARAIRRGGPRPPADRHHASPPVVAESPAPAPVVPSPAPEQPAQLAAGPAPDPVLRRVVSPPSPSDLPGALDDERSSDEGGSDEGRGGEGPSGCREHGRRHTED